MLTYCRRGEREKHVEANNCIFLYAILLLLCIFIANSANVKVNQLMYIYTDAS